MTVHANKLTLALAIIERKHAEIAALTQRAEAAEAERDEMEQQLLSAERNALAVSLSQRWRPMRLDETKAECDTLRAERDALLVINGDLARDNETLEAEREALRKCEARELGKQRDDEMGRK